MAHVSYLEKDAAAESVRPIFDAAAKYGPIPNMLRALAHNAEILQGFVGLNRALSKMKLDPKLRELAYLKASTTNRCDYCLSHHRSQAGRVGLSETQVANIGNPAPGADFDELQWDVVRFADQVSRNVKADAELIARLKQRLSDQELVELTATVALANFTNRVNEALAIELP